MSSRGTPQVETYLGVTAVVCSEPMRALMERVRRVAQTDATVVVTGESGSGKEIVARRCTILASLEQAVRGRELRCAARHAGRKRAVRPRKRGLQRRRYHQAGPVRTRRRRHHLPDEIGELEAARRQAAEGAGRGSLLPPGRACAG